MDTLNKLIALMVALVPDFLKDRIAHDKVLHFCAGILFGILGGALAVVFSGSAWWAVAAAMLAGLLKEGLDAFANYRTPVGVVKPHTVDPLDVLWTALGGVVVALALMLVFSLPAGIPAVDFAIGAAA